MESTFVVPWLSGTKHVAGSLQNFGLAALNKTVSRRSHSNENLLIGSHNLPETANKILPYFLHLLKDVGELRCKRSKSTVDQHIRMFVNTGAVNVTHCLRRKRENLPILCTFFFRYEANWLHEMTTKLIEGLWVSWKWSTESHTLFKPVHEFRPAFSKFICEIWVKFGIRNINIILLSIWEFCENRNREGPIDKP